MQSMDEKPIIEILTTKEFSALIVQARQIAKVMDIPLNYFEPDICMSWSPNQFYSLFQSFQTIHGTTDLLKLALINKFMPFVKVLLAASQRDFPDDMAMVAQYGYVDIVREFFDDPRMDMAKKGGKILIMAMEYKRQEIVTLLFTHPQIDMDEILSMAIKDCRHALVLHMVQNPQIYALKNMDKALNEAAGSGMTEVVSFLLQDERVTITDEGKAVLDKAIFGKHYQMIALLLKDPGIKVTDANALCMSISKSYKWQTRSEGSYYPIGHDMHSIIQYQTRTLYRDIALLLAFSKSLHPYFFARQMIDIFKTQNDTYINAAVESIEKGLTTEEKRVKNNCFLFFHHTKSELNNDICRAIIALTLK